MTKRIEVRLGSGTPDAAEGVDRVLEVAERLDIEVAVVGEPEPGIMIGDVALAEAASAPSWKIEAAVLRALEPSHVVFLCVANSARSQLAEGLGRLLAPDGVRVSSAGSEPTRVRPQAVEVLREVGIDISGHESKGFDDIERPVDAVVTLCAEEVCPVWLEDSWRLHWGLPDPAAVEGTEEERLSAFRETRDELTERLGLLFQGRS